jgi:Domain of unknown function (DUF4145)
MRCPHCLKHFHETWHHELICKEQLPGEEFWWVVGHTRCAACGRVILELAQGSAYQVHPGRVTLDRGSVKPVRLVQPKTVSREPLSPDVPKEFAADYREACLVLPDSEKASAALSRRCLQHLLREKAGIMKDDLAKEIQQVLDSKQLPTHLAEDLDAVRNIGNFAAHPLKATNTGEIVSVEPHEAEWLLTLLEQLSDSTSFSPSEQKPDERPSMRNC